MTTSTLERPKSAYFAADVKVSRSFKGHEVEARDGVHVVKGVEIFRAGTFRDSWGEQSTWTDMHLQQMVSNFELLRTAGTFPDVPVRRDHSYSIDKVIGYFDRLYVQGDKLVADLLITEPDQVEKIGRGTYRSVSLELGMYVSNDEAAYWPTVMGVAYVDIPAVEGLHSKAIPSNVSYFTRHTEENTNVTTTDDRGAARVFKIKGVDTSDFAAVQAHIDELEKRPAPFAFRVNGVETHDFAAVQAHVTALEAFASETVVNGRKAFVTGLANEKKIVAAQVESLNELVVAMSDEQFEKFKKSYEMAPAMSLLADHGSGGTNKGESDSASEKVILEEQLAMHRRAGMSDDEIQNTKAYKRLAQISK